MLGLRGLMITLLNDSTLFFFFLAVIVGGWMLLLVIAVVMKPEVKAWGLQILLKHFMVLLELNFIGMFRKDKSSTFYVVLDRF